MNRRSPVPGFGLRPLSAAVLSVVLGACGDQQATVATPLSPSGGSSGGVVAGVSAGQAGVGAAGVAGVATGSAGRAAAGVGGQGGQAAGAEAAAPRAGASAPAGTDAGVGGASAPAAGAGSGGSGGSGGAAGGSAGAAAPSEKIFPECRFHFGTTDGIAKDRPDLIKQLDFFTPGWMGLKDTFDMQYVCDYTKSGGLFEKQVPAVVAYVAAFYAKRVGDLKDCNAPGPQQDLCVAGASIITRDLDKIIAIYESYAQGFAGCYGTTRPIIFMMEPDFFQYTISNQSEPWTPSRAGEIMGQFVGAIKKHLPNAVFSLDISPWVPPNNGQDQGKTWFSNFDMSLFTFINTSGGGTSAGTEKIRDSNNMTWRGVSEAAGKPLLADTGYGVNGSSAGHDMVWDNPDNIRNRMQDGVVSISQYNPDASWPSTIDGLRAMLPQPSQCP